MSCKYITEFKKKPLEERKKTSYGMIAKYTDRIPIIIGKKDNSNLNDIDKNKYLCPSDLTLSQFTYVVRKRISIKPTESLFIFFNNKIYSQDTLLSLIYRESKDNDGFLYAVYCIESTFG